MAANRRVLLEGWESSVQNEYTAYAAFKPGHLLMRDPAQSGKLKKHTGGQLKEIIVAPEDRLQGKTIDDAFAADDHVIVRFGKSGAVVNGFVPASAAAIVKGDLLVSNGDGCVKLYTAYLTDNTGGTGNTTLADVGTVSTSGGNTYADSAINAKLAIIEDNFADLAATINATKHLVCAVAEEDVDNSANASSEARLAFRFI